MIKLPVPNVFEVNFLVRLMNETILFAQSEPFVFETFKTKNKNKFIIDSCIFLYNIPNQCFWQKVQWRC